MKDNIKYFFIGIALLLLAGLLVGINHNNYISHLEKTTALNTNNLNLKNTIIFNELDVTGQKYTAHVNFVTSQNMKEFVGMSIEKDIKLLLNKKSIFDVSESDITDIIMPYKERGIIICSIDIWKN